MKTKRGFSYSTVYVVLVFILAFHSCGRLIAPYNQYSYERAIEIKQQSLALLEKATQPYEEYAEQVEGLFIDLKVMLEYVRGIPKNELTVEQWEIMANPDGYLLGGMLMRWKEQGTLSGVFIEEAQSQISEGFDSIINLEREKLK